MSAPPLSRRPIVAAATVLAASAVAVLPAATGNAVTSGFHGVSWADPRDNVTDDAVVPGGLSTAASYATTKAKAGRIHGCRTDLGADTARLPVDVAGVGVGVGTT